MRHTRYCLLQHSACFPNHQTRITRCTGLQDNKTALLSPAPTKTTRPCGGCWSIRRTRALQTRLVQPISLSLSLYRAPSLPPSVSPSLPTSLLLSLPPSLRPSLPLPPTRSLSRPGSNLQLPFCRREHVMHMISCSDITPRNTE